MKLLIQISIILLFFQYNLVYSQDLVQLESNTYFFDKGVEDLGSESAYNIDRRDDLNTNINKRKIVRNSFIITTPIVTFIFGSKIWDWGGSDHWKWADEGWFEHDTDSGGADKIGHFFSHYTMTRIFYSIFNYTDKDTSMEWFYTIILTCTVGALIEVGDAYSGKYGFSYQDLIADYIGIAIASFLEIFPTIDKCIGFSVEYQPTKGFREYNDKYILNCVSDYSGWKYMMNFKLSALKHLGLEGYDFLRYIMFDLGYYTKGYTKYDKHENLTDHRRYWFMGISVNMMEVVSDFHSDKGSTFHWLTQQPFKYYHVPVGYKYNNTFD
ncbi:MAG: DUF2279 domain-containing protein [Spirochaetota bacterium]|nr:DUF2279 domain-containing protein [Spirochaetota bacterium]